MNRVTLLVTHLLGSGHLSRMLILARALKEAGFVAQVLSGGMPVDHLDQGGIDVVQLPPVRSDGASFTRLLSAAGDEAGEELLLNRMAAIRSALVAFEPDVLITELFPFGRRVLRREFEAALDCSRSLHSRPLVFASVRDILAPPSSEKKVAATEHLLREHYNGVFVHSDPDILPLEKSWPVSPGIAHLLHYTGFVAPHPSPAPDLRAVAAGDAEVVVTAGGGPVGRTLFETAIEAARLAGGRRWRLLVGGADALQVCRRLNESSAGAPIAAEPARQDYREILRACAAAIGQCGYNTAIDWLQAGVPGVFVPFAEAGEIEQTLRAESLGERFGYEVIAESQLTPARLAEATERALRRGRLGPLKLRLEGAHRTATLLRQFLDERR